MKTLSITFIVICFSFTTLGQNSFETVINSFKGEGLHYTFETNIESFLSVGFSKTINSTQEPYSPLIVEIDNNGELLGHHILTKSDTSYFFYYGLTKPNDNYYFIGLMSKPGEIHNRTIIYVCETTPDMQLVWEKYYPMPNEVTKAILIHFLTLPDNSILFSGKADTLENYTNDFIFNGILDLNGNLQDFNFYIDPYFAEYGVYSDFLYNFDSTAYYSIGNFTRGPYGIPVSFIEMDLDFNITNYTEFFNGTYFGTPLTAKWLPNGNLIIASRDNDYWSETEGLLVQIFDPDFNFVKDTFMIRPGMVYLPVFNGMDYTDPNNIWIATYNAMGGPTPNEVFYVQVFDSNMNLKGVQEFGGEKKLYRFYNLLATSDGGCLITGQVPACDTCENYNGYLFKTMPEDVVTQTQEHHSENQLSIDVYPNPFNEFINIRSDEIDMSIQIFDFTGNLIIDSGIIIQNTKLNTIHLSEGLYFYQFKHKQHVVKHGKLIKQ
ncbi:MAG: T9SS type A sorting domain-containing protein [Bacteroidales bacterium]|nr:T9SS type A sorting domain-containing protein [Bacteroidales bacterium]